MCSMQMYYMHTHYKDKVPGSMHSRVFLSSLQSGGRGRGGGNSRRSVSDGSPDLTGSFTSDFIQPHAATLHMVKLSQAHTHICTPTHCLALTHRRRARFTQAQPGNGFYSEFKLKKKCRETDGKTFGSQQKICAIAVSDQDSQLGISG